MKHYWLVCILLLLPQAAYAATAEQANFALNLFIHACVEHMGQDTDKIAQWAKDQHILSADSFDKDAFIAKGEQLRQVHDKIGTNLDEAFAEAIADLSASERQTLANALEHEHKVSKAMKKAE